MTAPMRAALVGEVNPYGGNPRYALYPVPSTSAGGRLCRKVLQLDPKDYIRQYARVNLCVGKWSMPQARQSAFDVLTQMQQRSEPVVLLGARVCGAFRVPFHPCTEQRAGPNLRKVLVIPHPSGLNRFWNGSDAYAFVRTFLRVYGVIP